MLEIRLLGQFDVQWHGRPVLIQSRRAQSLLARLALTPGIYRRREKLAGEFWPDTSEQNARSNLRHALWRIRGALMAAGALPDEPVLLSNNIGVTFNPRMKCWLDAQQLELASQLAARNEGSVEMLMQAAALYQGELLPGFYDDWVIPHRTRYQMAFDLLMARLLSRLREAGRWHEAFRWGTLWLLHGEDELGAARELALARRNLDMVGDAADRLPRLIPSEHGEMHGRMNSMRWSFVLGHERALAR